MKEHFLKESMIADFRMHLVLEEKSTHTIEKYLRDVRTFAAFVGGNAVCKETTLAYKQHLLDENYALRSVNSMLASLNSLLCWLGWHECRVKALKTQKQIFCTEENELTRAEYQRLVHAANRRGKERLSLILQCICSTGIRVSELEFITVEAARNGKASISCKGKTRTVFLVKELQKKLLRYASQQNIHTGCVFVTRSGRSIGRTNIWREMKALCDEANVEPGKVFPHNLRHLFARVFYALEKDIAKLADILGHSSINTTRIYIVSTGTEHRRRMEHMHLLV